MSYLSSACVPSSGYTALIIGQDYYSILNYTSSSINSNLLNQPKKQHSTWGLMSYTSLHGGSGDLSGLLTPVDYGSGIEWSFGLIDKFPGAALQLGLWFVGSEDFVAQGKADNNIDKLINFVSDMTIRHRLNNFDNDITEYDNDNRNDIKKRKKKDKRALTSEEDITHHRLPLIDLDSDSNQSQDQKSYQDMSFYIRLGYEFDNPENKYNPNSYIKAFRRIVQRFRDNNLTNVAFVWHSYGSVAYNNNTFYDWYPGDDYVDWCGVSIFKQPYSCQTALKCEMEFIDEFSTFCTSAGHPIMIAESTPYGGIIDDKDASIAGTTNKAGYSGSTWNRWMEPVLQYIEKHNVRIWCYINCDWDSQPMWKVAHAPGEAWGDTRIQEYPDLMDKWRRVVLSSRRFSWSVGTVSNKVCAKHINDDDNDDHINDDNKKFYHITILGHVIVIDPFVIGIMLVLIIASIIRILRKRQRLRWDFDFWQSIGLRNRRSYTIIN